MPFTFAHPSIILPFTYRAIGLSTTALTIGSIIPDFEHLLTLSDNGKWCHTWLGMLAIDLPSAFIISYLYHYFVRELIINHLPKVLYVRLKKYKNCDWNKHVRERFIAITFSFLIGIFSHIAWDTLTHFNPATFQKYPILLYPVRFSTTHVIGLFVLIWYLSSIIGLLVIGIVIYNIRPDERSGDSIYFPLYWKLVAMVSILLFSVRTLIGPIYANFPQLFIAILGVFIWAVLIISISYKLKLLTT